MVNRVQVGYPALMKVITKPKPIEIGLFYFLLLFYWKKKFNLKNFLYFIKLDEYMPEMTIEKKELDIDSDMQLKSNYLDRKVTLKFVFLCFWLI